MINRTKPAAAPDSVFRTSLDDGETPKNFLYSLLKIELVLEARIQGGLRYAAFDVSQKMMKVPEALGQLVLYRSRARAGTGWPDKTVQGQRHLLRTLLDGDHFLPLLPELKVELDDAERRLWIEGRRGFIGTAATARLRNPVLKSCKKELKNAAVRKKIDNFRAQLVNFVVDFETMHPYIIAIIIRVSTDYDQCPVRRK